ncbi:TetR/AcrR family transcriptional regulator [soil metagenome]
MEKIAKIGVKTPTRDAEATRNSILDAAEQEFSKVGLWGARTESIAARTGVTKAMIHYYFENKENLYRAVMERLIARRSADMASLHITDLSPTDAVTAFVQSMLRSAAENPNVISLIVLEALQNEGKYYSETSLGSLYGPLIESLKRGMSSGEFNEADPLHVAANIVGICVFYMVSRDNLKSIWPEGTDLLAPEMLDEHNSIALKMCLAAILAK